MDNDQPPGGDAPPITLHEAQRPPEGAWRVWMFMGGRGAGKTRAGAEWVRAMVMKEGARRVALVGPTLGDVREVMIEGPSGLRTISPEGERPDYVVSRRMLCWPNGAFGYAFSAEDPESLRGPQFDTAWCDEIGAWAKGKQVWDMLMFGLRIGRMPRAVATTTPRAVKLVKDLVEKCRRGAGVVMTRGGTHINAANLSPYFLDMVEDEFNGTHLGRQEIGGELLDDRPGALWTRDMIEKVRSPASFAEGPFERVVIAVDPPARSGPRSNACGIIAAGLRDKVVYVLEDASVRGMRPGEWAARVGEVAERRAAGVVVAEVNQGGDMVREVLEINGVSAARGLRVKMIHAVQSKRDRAEPVSSHYEQMKVRHAGAFPELEDEMCTFGSPDAPASPDRMDALVWAVRELIGGAAAAPKINVV